MSPPDTTSLTHEHVFLGAAHDRNARRTLWVVGLTAVMMVGEIVAGLLTGSMALLADGFHMATHAGALAASATAYAYARRHASSPRFSFGTGKVGDLAGFGSALVLGVVALAMALESVMRLFQPVDVAFVEATWIAVLGLVVNLASAVLLAEHHGPGRDHGHGDRLHDHHDHHHHDHHDHPRSTRDAAPGHAAPGRDNNLRAAYVHVLADALTSVLAIVALLAGRHLGWVWLDPAMGIVGGLVIGRWSWVLMRDTAGVLLDITDTAVANEIRGLVEGRGDAIIVDLHVWRIGPQAHAGIVSVAGAPGLDAGAIRARLAPVHELAHLTVELSACGKSRDSALEP